VTQTTFPSNLVETYGYEAVGNLPSMGKIQQVSEPTGTYGFAYDNMGRLMGTTTQYSLPTCKNCAIRNRWIYNFV
jgi:YD repeat-containing protein